MSTPLPAGIAARVVRRSVKDGPQLRRRLRLLGYVCPLSSCNRLLASGARCPQHEHLKPHDNNPHPWQRA